MWLFSSSLTEIVYEIGPFTTKEKFNKYKDFGY